MYIINLCKVCFYGISQWMLNKFQLQKIKNNKKKKLIKRSGNLTSEEELNVSQNSAQIFSPYQRSG